MTIKERIGYFFRLVWETVKGSLLIGLMYFAASLLVLLIEEKGSSYGKVMAWAIGAIIVAGAYNAFYVFVRGGEHFEALVTGNMKRRSAMKNGYDLNIKSYKPEKEYRVWKGIAIGVLLSLFAVIGGLVMGANQKVIIESLTAGKDDPITMSKGLQIFVLIFDIFAGWALLPFQVMNIHGISVSMYWGCLLGIIPVLLSGGFYIWGAYARRAKRLREQEIAAKAAEESLAKPQKINYGGLPGTKPRKRK